MKKILIIEDEASMRLGLTDNLEFEGYAVEEAENGKIGLEKVSQTTFDLILLDIMMPEMSGYQVCKKIRALSIDTPILFLSAKGEEMDKVLGLEIGADDYVQKPFSLMELLARIKAILRRTSSQSNAVTIGRLHLDFETLIALEDGINVKLSHKEFEIIQYLYQHKNQVVDRYALLENVWGYDNKPTTRTVDNFIVKLRQKIEQEHTSPRHIITIHGVGYKLIP